ncbi:3-oxoacyl-reductase FabG [Rhypophila sp. PSN 637]
MATPTPFFNIVGKTVAITGATGGIGSAIASRFLQEGARLLLIGRDQFKLDMELSKQRDKAKTLKSAAFKLSYAEAAKIQHPDRHASYLLRSLTDMDEWKRITRDVHHEIDVLVNCAGMSQASLLPRTREPDINHLIGTNLTGAIIASKAVVSQMLRRKNKKLITVNAFSGGVVINVASLLGQLGTPGTSVYAATKAGLVGFTKSLATEFAPHIRANAVLPGFVDTNMTAYLQNQAHPQTDPQSKTTPVKSNLLNSIPMQRLGLPEEVADAVYFLVRNQYANGCLLNLDGGLGSLVATATTMGSTSNNSGAGSE